MHPTGVASAAWVFAAAPSKIPFYVAGGMLAAWAVALALYGITHPDFPGSLIRARLVGATTVALVLVTVGMAAVTGGHADKGHAGQADAARPAASGGGSGTLALAADPTGQLAYDRTKATVGAGTVRVRLVNKSPIPHDVTIARGARTLAQTKTIQAATATTTADLAPGDYVFYCSVPGHRDAGMQGDLTVR
jgi:uncharacterized cupredoxin-like copper-binding protein